MDEGVAEELVGDPVPEEFIGECIAEEPARECDTERSTGKCAGKEVIAEFEFAGEKEVGEAVYRIVQSDSDVAGVGGQFGWDEGRFDERGWGRGHGWRRCWGLAEGEGFEEGLHAGDSLFDGVEVVHGFGGVELEAGEGSGDIGRGFVGWGGFV